MVRGLLRFFLSLKRMLDLDGFEVFSMRKNVLLNSALASLLLLGACGGGGGSGSNNPRGDVVQTPVDDVVAGTDYVMPPLVDVIPPSDDFVSACDDIVLPDDYDSPPIDDDITAGGNIGILVDSPVSGLAYETLTHQGVTGLDGGFQYEDGESVRFMLGDTLLGEVTGQAQITPFDLANSVVVTGMSAVTGALENEDDPFHTVINIAVLLQSLDQDADPNNSIEISPEVAALFQGVSIDLNQHWEIFLQEFKLRYALGQANALSLFSEPRGIVNPAPAVQHLYNTLAINAGTFGISLEESDWDGDGASQDSSSWHYDIGGNVTRRESSGGDGRLHGVDSWTYDTHGDRTQYEREEYGQQSIEGWQYDTIGNLTRHETDEDGDGTLDIFEIWRYQYGADGKLTRVEREVFDEIGDSRPGSVTTYQYDVDGKLIRVELNGDGLRLTAETLGISDVQYLEFAENYTVTYEYDADGSLTGDIRNAFNADLGRNVESRQYDAKGNVTRYEGRLQQYGPPASEQIAIFEYEYQYDARGNVTREVWDENADGKPDDIMHYEYDSNGNVTREANDWDADGKTDEITSYEYDTAGKVTREVVDWDADAEPDQITNYQYDAQGSLTRLELDYDADGTVDETESWPYEYEYESQGNLVRRILDQNGDGTPNEILSYAYHANGNLAREDHWSTEGAEHDISIRQYDPGGNLTREEFDYGGNGTLETIVSYQYDACASKTRREAHDGDDMAGSIESWRYGTTGHLRRYEWANRQFQWPIGGSEIPDVFDGWQSDGYEGWQYDSLDRLTRYQLACDGDCIGGSLDSLPDQIVNYEYDINGNMKRELNDDNGDGKADRVMAYEYDASGNVTRELSDEEGDGDADRVTSYQYDADNHLTRREEDEDADGRPNSIEIREYDANGNIILEESDWDGDGTPEETATFQYQYDGNGNLTREDEDEDGDGKADNIIYREYDANGNVTRREQDENGDGVLDNIETRQYDPEGNLVREAIDGEGDGTPDRVRTYQYDDESNLIRESEANYWESEDGVFEEMETRHYGPTGWGFIFATP